MRTRDPTQKVDCKKRMKEATRGCSLLFFLLWYYSPLHPLPLSPYSRWPSFSIAAIFVYGTSRRRKRGRSDDAEEASARGGCGRESEDVRPWDGQGRLENRWRGSADSSPARIANGWFCKERKGKKKESGKRREAQRKETRNGQKDNIESRGSERGGEIPEKSPGIDGQDDADQSPGFVSRSPDPKPIRVFPSLRNAIS